MLPRGSFVTHFRGAKEYFYLPTPFVQTPPAPSFPLVVEWLRFFAIIGAMPMWRVFALHQIVISEIARAAVWFTGLLDLPERHLIWIVFGKLNPNTPIIRAAATGITSSSKPRFQMPTPLPLPTI